MNYVVVDAFTSTRFSGNSAAICLLASELAEQDMQAIAAEFNLSETAYIAQQGEVWSLRWFTPVTEVNLCGHATLAAAHALWHEFGDQSEVLRFMTRSGELTVMRTEQLIQMRFPLVATTPVDVNEWALSVAQPAAVQAAASAQEDALIELDNATSVSDFVPDLAAIAALGTRGLIVTAKGDSGSGVDFVSRFFAPNAGINEDPVTGSAHCALAHYWSPKMAKNSFVAKQVSRRGGDIGVAIEGDTVVLSGQAVTTMKGELRL
ncbi:putative isomerase YddE [Zhongshania aliphaticivorans]|uniref:Putative isomerase YddE n=1 Tax=Zhongshania aliphaticivorans TaxID=1470434 RepID=A0A5S9MUV2_9GAMM|nr:PhzF family phenazine biosynthesis protein [Zhongshania aliphaticivorans]CAA0080770.1 putative isomerase YddE [Zhongshania aliphaticivorans]CAA0085384.1 putative isomerase YddE [Zhongshania aliphaticivorans]